MGYQISNVHAHTLLSVMEQHNWGWDLYNMIGKFRPYLVDVSEQFVGYPCSVGEQLDEILFQLEHDYDGPAKNHLLCFHGIPTDEQFTALWQSCLRMEKLSIAWCDMNTRVKWQRQLTAMIDEHHPGGVRAALTERPWES